MNAFVPPKTTGLAVGLGASALLLALSAAALAGVAALPPSPAAFLLLCLALLSLPATVWVVYRTAGLAGAHYHLTRDALTVAWGSRREVIPLDEIEEAHPAAEFAGELRPPALRWPGCIVGLVTQPELGVVEFLATTTEKQGLVLIGYPGGWLALSPPAPDAFLAALAERRAEGVAAPVRAVSVYPALPQWPLWRDRLALGLIAAGGLALLALIGYFTFIFPQLPPQMALRFNAQGEPIRFGPPRGLFTLAYIGAVAWTLNTLAGIGLHRREQDRAMAYLLFGATLLVMALVWTAAIGLLTAGRA